MPIEKEFKYKYPNEGRWNHSKGKWVSAEEDFEDLRKHAYREVSREEQYEIYENLAKLDQPGISQFCKFILSGIDKESYLAPRKGKKAPRTRLNRVPATLVAKGIQNSPEVPS